MKKKCKLKKKNESGQSLVEFALVLPLFMLILMGIMDFGWLFYNYIGVENSARNAARIACVEYTDTNLGRDEDYDNHIKVPQAVTYDPNLIDNDQNFNRDEQDIIHAVSDSKPSSVRIKSVTVEYSEDTKFTNRPLDYYKADINDTRKLSGTLRRANGDVKVTVNAEMHVLTPVLGIFSDHMKYNLRASSTYKVERMSDSEAPDGD